MSSSSSRAELLEPAIAALPLLDQTGASRPLRDLWAGGTAVVIFLRHFG
ncbi:MAG: hypothetical protein WA208_04025 [Thermoanaerobaculia bacterium]